MGLLDALDGAKLAIVDPEQRVVYAWFGGSGVNIYDEDGREVNYFTVGGVSKVTATNARAAIARMMAYHRSEEE
jgi:hypothetical protein